MSDPGCFPSNPREGPHSSTGRKPFSVWEPPLCDTVMSVCPHCDSVDSRGGLDGGSQERKAQAGQASHLEMSLPGAVQSGLSDGWSTQGEGAGRPKDGRENFGMDLALAQHILGLPARHVGHMGHVAPLRPRGRRSAPPPPRRAPVADAGTTPRHTLHRASQTCAQVTCGKPFWTQSRA